MSHNPLFSFHKELKTKWDKHTTLLSIKCNYSPGMMTLVTSSVDASSYYSCLLLPTETLSHKCGTEQSTYVGISPYCSILRKQNEYFHGFRVFCLQVLQNSSMLTQTSATKIKYFPLKIKAGLSDVWICVKYIRKWGGKKNSFGINENWDNGDHNETQANIFKHPYQNRLLTYTLKPPTESPK